MKTTTRLAGARIAAAIAASPARARDEVSFGLNRMPEGEHCGFVRAKATSLHEKAGLDLELRPGNPPHCAPVEAGDDALSKLGASTDPTARA